MAKIYISSIYSDLENYRKAVKLTLERMGHTVNAMEVYTATGRRPLDKCLADVAACDAYVGIFAWRYGYIPDKDNPAQKAITELEYRCAIEKGKECLIFLLDPDAPWRRSLIERGEGEKRIEALRNELSTNHTVDFFKDVENLTTLVSTAVYQWEKDKAQQDSKTTPTKPDATFYVKQAVDALDSFSAAERKDAVEFLAQTDHPAAREELVEALSHLRKDVRIHASIAMAKFKDERAVPALIEALLDEDQHTVNAAVHALTQIGAPASPSLRIALRDNNAVLRDRAAWVLGKITPADAVQELIAALRDNDENVRKRAANALAHTGAPALPGLIEALDDDDDYVGSAGAWALGQIEKPDAVPRLLDVLRKRTGSRLVAAIETLGKIEDGSAVPGLVEQLSNRARAVRLLFSGSGSGIRLEKERVCDVAAQALENIGTPESLAAVKTWRSEQGVDSSTATS